MDASELNSNGNQKNWIDPFDYHGLDQQNVGDESDSDFKTLSEKQEEKRFEIMNKEEKSKISSLLSIGKQKSQTKTKNILFRWSRLSTTLLIIGIVLISGLLYELYCRNLFNNDDCYISQAELKTRLKSLQRSLSTKVYGQHIAVKSIFNSMYSHLYDPNPEKPLVLSFHGDVGTGKTFAAEFIAQSLFKDGLNSNYVKSYLGPKHFYTDPNRIHETKIELTNIVESTVSACPRSLFIFDEADKMLPGVLDGVAPFLGYASTIDGIDYSKSIFIFLSNTGSSLINSKMYDHLVRDGKRQDFGAIHFRQLLQDVAFNDKSGLSKCDMILQRNVNHYIPFLPLEKKHVLACIKSYLDRKEIYDVDEEDIVKRKLFYPSENPIFAEAGCKNIAALVEPFKAENRILFKDDL